MLNRSHKINVIFKTCAPFRDCIKGIKSHPINYAKDLDVVMPMHNLIEYNNNYLKTSGSLWPYYRDQPGTTILNCKSFKTKIRITGKTSVDGNSSDVKIAVWLKYLIIIRLGFLSVVFPVDWVNLTPPFIFQE